MLLDRRRATAEGPMCRAPSREPLDLFSALGNGFLADLLSPGPQPEVPVPDLGPTPAPESDAPEEASPEVPRPSLPGSLDIEGLQYPMRDPDNWYVVDGSPYHRDRAGPRGVDDTWAMDLNAHEWGYDEEADKGVITEWDADAGAPIYSMGEGGVVVDIWHSRNSEMNNGVFVRYENSGQAEIDETDVSPELFGRLPEEDQQAILDRATPEYIYVLYLHVDELHNPNVLLEDGSFADLQVGDVLPTDQPFARVAPFPNGDPFSPHLHLNMWTSDNPDAFSEERPWEHLDNIETVDDLGLPFADESWRDHTNNPRIPEPEPEAPPRAPMPRSGPQPH